MFIIKNSFHRLREVSPYVEYQNNLRGHMTAVGCKVTLRVGFNLSNYERSLLKLNVHIVEIKHNMCQYTDRVVYLMFTLQNAVCMCYTSLSSLSCCFHCSC